LLLHIGNCIRAVNIAVALAKEFKLQVGLLDADIYGPSIPTMMNLHAKPEVNEGYLLELFQHMPWCTPYGLYMFKLMRLYT
jgi:ATP-binding protein involved in chromosome partitioning